MALALSIIISLMIGYFSFNYLLEVIGKEIATNFLEAEAIDIQHGNLFTPLLQQNRFLFSSKFVNGIKLYDTENGQTHISMGDNFNFKLPSEQLKNKLILNKAGFLHSHIFYFFDRKNLLLIYDIQSDFLNNFFYFFVVFLIILWGICSVQIKRIQQEEKLDTIAKTGKQLKYDFSSVMSSLVSVAQTSNGDNRRSLLLCYERIKTITDGLIANSDKKLRQN